MRVAIIHDALVARGGAERVVLALADLFPGAPIFTSVYWPRFTFPEFSRREVRTSVLQPILRRPALFRAALALYPWIFEHLDLKDFDLVVSSSAHWAKGVRPVEPAFHLSYCHTPSRIAWALDDYLKKERLPAAVRLPLKLYSSAVFRRWDIASASRVDQFIANSRETASRIARVYGRSADVLPPPIQFRRYRVNTQRDFFLVVARLNAYKRVDLTVRAFTELGLPLVVVGDGPMRARLQAEAGANVTFAGAVGDEELLDYYARCHAVVVSCEEDFGLVALEANASGRPAVVYAKGGALEVVREGITGVFFREQTVDSLKAAIRVARANGFDPAALRDHARHYDVAHFQRRFADILHGHLYRRQGREGANR